MNNFYAKFTEHNDWEGETWNFYVPIEGNEKALDLLLLLIHGEEETYELDSTPISESDVDVLVKHGGDTDYMAAHNKLSGALVITPEVEAKIKDPEDDPLYKGGIQDFMQEREFNVSS